MNDTELLQAMKDIIAPLESKIDNMRKDITGIKGEITGIKGDIADIKNRLGNVETEVVKTNLNIENRIIPYMQLLKEGYDGVRDTVNGLKKRTDNNEEDIIVLKVLEKIIEGFAKIK